MTMPRWAVVGMTMAARVQPVTKSMRRWAVGDMTMRRWVVGDMTTLDMNTPRWVVEDMATRDTIMPVRPKPGMTIQHTITLTITTHPVTGLCGAPWLSPSTPALFGPPQLLGQGWRSHSIP